jgi:hypothetical protein
MIIFKLLSVIALIAIASGCNTTSDSNDTKATVASSKKTNLVCDSRPRTGSNVRRKKCISKALADELRRESQEAMRRTEKIGRIGEKGTN